MKSLRNEQFNQPLAENQEEYNTLYVNVNTEDPLCQVTSCFELTLDEIEEISKTGKIYYQQCLFTKEVVDEKGVVIKVPANLFHPMSIHVTNPLD